MKGGESLILFLKRNCLHIWNLDHEKIIASLKSEHFSKGIINLIEVDYLKVVVIGSTDNVLSVWDMVGLKMLFKVTVGHENLNKIIYFSTY